MEDVRSVTGSSPRQDMNTTGPSKRKRKNCSDVWNHFTELKIENNIRHVKCNWCSYTYQSNPTDGTTNMSRHVRKCPGLKNLEPRPIFEESVFREKLVTIVVKHLLPYSFVEYDAVRDLPEYLNPHVITITRNNCKADTMKLHEKTKNNVKEVLKCVPENICLTSDIWTSIATEGYLALTAHFVDENWVLQKLVLNLHHIETPHTRRALAACLLELLREWGIDKKIFTITLDNASNNDAMVDVLKDHFNLSGSLICNGKYFHVRCGAHVLNLIVKACLKIIDGSVNKIRDCVKYVRNGEARKESFARCIIESSLPCTKKVIQDIPIRWNSTYLMLDSALHFRLAFEKLKNVDLNFTCCPLANEWEKVQQLSKFLKPFQLITTFFSG